MPRPKNPRPPGATPPVIAPSKTSHLFSRRKVTTKGPITRETIEADLAAFREAGGKIEVLGHTRALRRFGPDADATPTDPPPMPAKRRR